MQPHEIRCAVVMREADASFLEIARALHVSETTVRSTLLNELAMQDYRLWWCNERRTA